MSGPKVVRVVTREERIAICSALIAQLERAINTWITTRRRIGDFDEATIADVNKRRDQIIAELHADNFRRVEQQVPQEIAFLTHDIELHRQRAVERNTQSAVRLRQQRQNAKMLLAELERKSISLDEDIRLALESISVSLKEIPLAEKTLAEGFKLLVSEASEPTLNRSQQKQAQSLALGQHDQSFSDWLHANEKKQDSRLHLIDQRLAELHSYFGDELTAAFTSRLQELENSPQSPFTDIHIDSLVIDLAEALTKAKRDSVLIAQAQDLLLELAANEGAKSDQQFVQIQAALENSIASRSVQTIEQLVEKGNLLLAKVKQLEAAKSRRAAILSGLAELGYEVREEMHTALAKNGRVVVEKPGLPGYGVELAGPVDAQRLQVRAVAFERDRNPMRERDVESLWCSDFKKLQDNIAAQGGAVTIEKALAIGAVPLHQVDKGDYIHSETSSSLTENRRG